MHLPALLTFVIVFNVILDMATALVVWVLFFDKAPPDAPEDDTEPSPLYNTKSKTMLLNRKEDA